MLPQATTSTDQCGPETSKLSIERRRRNHFFTASLGTTGNKRLLLYIHFFTGINFNFRQFFKATERAPEKTPFFREISAIRTLCHMNSPKSNPGLFPIYDSVPIRIYLHLFVIATTVEILELFCNNTFCFAFQREHSAVEI